MSQPFEDPYLNTFAGSAGENLLKFHGDGSVSVERKVPELRSSAFRDARRILRLPDSAIQELQKRKNGLRTFVIEGATVSWPHGKSKRYWCRSHNVNDCGHTRRLLRFMEGK